MEEIQDSSVNTEVEKSSTITKKPSNDGGGGK